jgi:hypothetical protein
MTNVGMNFRGLFTPRQDRRISQKSADIEMQPMGNSDCVTADTQIRAGSAPAKRASTDGYRALMT